MILCSGVFDGFHSGHARYLAAAKRLRQTADEEVRVAVAPDTYAANKQGKAPCWAQLERARALCEVEGVLPLVQAEDTVADVILRQKPRLFVKGEDWAGKLPLDVIQACREVGAGIVFVYAPGVHGTEARR